MPVVTTLDMELPCIMPIRPLDTTAVFAVAPQKRPVRHSERSIKNSPVPVEFNTAPNNTNINTTVTAE